MTNKVEVKMIDGGTRESCPTSKHLKPWNKRNSEIKTSYDTETVLKNKFDTKVKQDHHHGLNMSTSFWHISDDDWFKIFKK